MRRNSKEYYLSLGTYDEMCIEGLPSELLLRFYRFMNLVRRTEIALRKEYHPADEMKCPIHFCIGEEAAPTALSELIEESDYLFCDHRNHGFYQSKCAGEAEC